MVIADARTLEKLSNYSLELTSLIDSPKREGEREGERRERLRGDWKVRAKSEESLSARKFRGISLFSEGALLYLFGAEVSLPSFARSMKRRTFRQSIRIPNDLSDADNDPNVVLQRLLIYVYRDREASQPCLIAIFLLSISTFFEMLTTWYFLSYGASESSRFQLELQKDQLIFTFLKNGAWYTNGHFATFVTPAVLRKQGYADALSCLVTTFSLKTGEVIETKVAI